MILREAMCRPYWLHRARHRAGVASMAWRPPRRRRATSSSCHEDGVEVDRAATFSAQVAGSRDGISAFQLDVKELGLKAATLEKALAQAREARLHVLDEMASRGVDEPQALSDSVPKTKTLQVEPNKIGKIIGKGGETIRGLIADAGA